MPFNVVVKKMVVIPGFPDTLAIDVGSGKWTFDTPGFAWRYDGRIPPPAFNFAMYQNMEYPAQMRVDSLEDGVKFAHGFSSGYRIGRAQNT